MEMALNKGFCEISLEESEDVNGGGVVAAVYALGFVMNMTPAGALVTCGVIAVAAVAGGIAVSRA